VLGTAIYEKLSWFLRHTRKADAMDGNIGFGGGQVSTAIEAMSDTTSSNGWQFAGFDIDMRIILFEVCARELWLAGGRGKIMTCKTLTVPSCKVRGARVTWSQGDALALQCSFLLFDVQNNTIIFIVRLRDGDTALKTNIGHHLGTEGVIIVLRMVA